MTKLVVFVILRLILFITFIMCGKKAAEKSMSGRFKNNYWLCTLPAIIVYTLVEGLRYGRGADFSNYLLAYQNISLYNTERWGVAFTLLYKLMHLIDVPETLLFCVLSFITIVIYMFFMKHFREFSTYMLPLFFLATIIQSENLVRQFISMALSILAIMYCLKSNWLNSLLSYVISFLFHKASLSFAPFLFFTFFWTKRKHKLSKSSNNMVILMVLLTIYLIPLFVKIDFLNDMVLGYFFKSDSLLSDYESYSDATIFERDIADLSIFTQIKEWVMWGTLIVLGYNIKDKYASLGLPVIFYCFFIGSVIMHINSDSSLFRLNLYYTTTWFVIASAVIYDYIKNRQKYNILSHVLFFVFIVIMLQSYLPALVVPSLLGCDFVWDV